MVGSGWAGNTVVMIAPSVHAKILVSAGANFQLSGGAEVAPLPSPPMWERLLLEQSWATATVLALLGLVVTVILVRRREMMRAAGIGGGTVLVALAVLLTGRLVETPRETMARQTEELVFGVAGARRNVVAALLAADARLESPLSGVADGREAILALVDRCSQVRGPVRDHAVLEVQATQDGGNVGRTQVHVRVYAEGVPVFSWWRLDWSRGADGAWTCRRIESLWISGLSGAGKGP